MIVEERESKTLIVLDKYIASEPGRIRMLHKPEGTIDELVFDITDRMRQIRKSVEEWYNKN